MLYTSSVNLYMLYALFTSVLSSTIRTISRRHFHGLFFPSSSNSVLQAYSDGDWACDSIHSCSTIGYCFLQDDALISWLSKMQLFVARALVLRLKPCSYRHNWHNYWAYWLHSLLSRKRESLLTLLFILVIRVLFIHNDVFHE